MRRTRPPSRHRVRHPGNKLLCRQHGEPPDHRHLQLGHECRSAKHLLPSDRRGSGAEQHRQPCEPGRCGEQQLGGGGTTNDHDQDRRCRGLRRKPDPRQHDCLFGRERRSGVEHRRCQATGFNTLVVAALGEFATDAAGTATYNVVTTFSSRGPVEYRQPTSATSTRGQPGQHPRPRRHRRARLPDATRRLHGAGSSPSAYSTSAGTSFASPDRRGRSCPARRLRLDAPSRRRPASPSMAE